MTSGRWSAALANADRAFGARDVRAGFCFDHEDDLAFALGFPYLRWLDPEHLDDIDPRASAEQIAIEPGAELRTTFGPASASLVARVWLLPEPMTTYPEDLELTAEGHAALLCPTSLSEAEANARIVAALHPELIGALVPEALLLVEALVGPSVVTSAVVEGAAGWAARPDLFADPSRARVLALTAMMGHRLLPPERAALLRELDSIVSPLSAAERERAGLSWEGPSASVVPGSPVVSAPADRVRAIRTSHRGAFGPLPDPRLGFLAGQSLLELEAQTWPAYQELPAAIWHPLTVERFAPIQSRHGVALLIDLWWRGAAPDLAFAALVAHADFARAEAEAMASGAGPLALQARSFSERIETALP
jgi:hypothetical protein